MSIDVTCRCGRSFQAPDAAAGKRGRCKACGAVVPIPIPVAVATPDVFAVADTEPDPPPEPDEPVVTGIIADDDLSRIIKSKPPVAPLTHWTPPPASTDVPPEPWFYGFIAGVAMLALVVGLGACLLAFLASASSLVASSAAEDARDGDARTAISMYFLMCSCLAPFPIFLTTAPIFLAVDVARNIRAMRYKP